MKRSIMIAGIIIFSIISLLLGAKSMTVNDILSGDTVALQVLLSGRFPRLVSVLISGATMAIAGLIMQQLSRNKFVSPSTAATIDSAQMGVVIAMVFIPNLTSGMKMGMAFTFSLIGTVIFMLIVQRIQFKDVIFVPLIGMMFGGVVGSITQFIAYRYDLVQNATDWLQGDFSLILKGNYEALYICLPLLLLSLAFANHFNIVGMGESFAKNLGVNYNFILYFGLGIVAILTASVVVTVGSIPFVGLVIPNIVSILKGDRLKGILIDTALLGSLFVLLCDIFGRLIIYPYEIPIGLTVGIIGSALFLALIFRRESR